MTTLIKWGDTIKYYNGCELDNDDDESCYIHNFMFGSYNKLHNDVGFLYVTNYPKTDLYIEDNDFHFQLKDYFIYNQCGEVILGMCNNGMTIEMLTIYGNIYNEIMEILEDGLNEDVMNIIYNKLNPYMTHVVETIESFKYFNHISNNKKVDFL